MKNKKRNTTNAENNPAIKSEISRYGYHNRKNKTPIMEMIKKITKSYIECYFKKWTKKVYFLFLFRENVCF